jgi:hypothetical protein
LVLPTVIESSRPIRRFAGKPSRYIETTAWPQLARRVR